MHSSYLVSDLHYIDCITFYLLCETLKISLLMISNSEKNSSSGAPNAKVFGWHRYTSCACVEEVWSNPAPDSTSGSYSIMASKPVRIGGDEAGGMLRSLRCCRLICVCVFHEGSYRMTCVLWDIFCSSSLTDVETPHATPENALYDDLAVFGYLGVPWSKQQEIREQCGSDEDKAVEKSIEWWLEHATDVSWRKIIHSLYETEETAVADGLKQYSEPPSGIVQSAQ